MDMFLAALATPCLWWAGKEVLKKTGTQLLDAFGNALLDRTRQGTLPKNHHLDHALRLSLAKATQVLAYAIHDPNRESLSKLIGELRIGKLADRFLETVQGNILAGTYEDYWLHELIWRAQPDEFKDFPLEVVLTDNQFAALLNENLSPALSDHIHGAYLEWVRVHVTEAQIEPKAFQEYVLQGWPHPSAAGKQITFYEVFCIFFREELKTNDVVFKAYMIATQAELKSGIDVLLSQLASEDEKDKLKVAVEQLGDFEAFQSTITSQNDQIICTLGRIEKTTARTDATAERIEEVVNKSHAVVSTTHAITNSTLGAVEELKESQLSLHQKVDQMAAVFPVAPSYEDSPASGPIAATLGRQDLRAMGTFVGREADIAEIARLLQCHRLVTIRGPGGIGKTRLADEVMRAFNETNNSGIRAFFVSFEALLDASREVVIETLLSAMGLADFEDGNPMDVLVRQLGAFDTLLVLDNCETAHADVAEVTRTLINSCISLTILATSQKVLGLDGIEKVYPLSPLTVPGRIVTLLADLETFDGYRLFRDRVRSREEEWPPKSIDITNMATVLKLTDGIPLAIEIVAAWVPYKTLAMIADELTKTPLGQVSTRDPQDNVDHERHRSMERCLEWSFTCLQRLNPNDADGFIRLAVFEGAFTAAAVDAVCQVSDAVSLLRRLDRTSLIHVVPNTNPCRYQLFNLTRSYARTKAIEFGWEDQLRKLHLEYYGRMATGSEKEDDNEVRTSCAVSDDWRDMLAAAHTAASIGPPDYVWHISRFLGNFLQIHGLLGERERLCRAAVRAAWDVHAFAPMEIALLNLGMVLEARGKPREAEKQYQSSLDSVRRKPQPNLARNANALRRLCLVQVKLGAVDKARTNLETLEEIAANLETPSLKARNLDAVAECYKKFGELEKAETLILQSLAIKQASQGGDAAIAWSMRAKGLASIGQRRFGEAEASLKQSLAYWKSRNDVRQQAFDLHALGDLCQRQSGREADCLTYYRESLAFRGDEPKDRALTLYQYGRSLRIQRDYDSAQKALWDSQRICMPENPAGAGRALMEIGKTHMARREWDPALDAFTQAQIYQEKAHDLRGLAMSWQYAGNVHAMKLDWPSSRISYMTALEYCRKASGRILTAWAHINIATRLYAAQGDKRSAREHISEAIAMLRLPPVDTGVLPYAIELSRKINDSMQDGRPWRQWRAETFAHYHKMVRLAVDGVRKQKQPDALVAAHLALVADFHEAGRDTEEALAFAELGSAYRQAKDYVHANEAIAKAMSMFRELCEPLGEATCWHKFGDLYADQMMWREAEEAYKKAVEIRTDYGDEVGLAISLDPLARVYIMNRNMVAAKAALESSRTIVRDVRSPWQKWHPLGQLMWVNLSGEDMPAAREIARELAAGVTSHRGLAEKATALLRLVERGASAQALVLLEAEGFGRGDRDA
jgi:predicted ATPase/tetratricopeptide (TPR) repeat protein